jgi:hypothetical protein
MTDQERTLRAAFEAAAGRVDVAHDALPAIRARVGARARQRRLLTVSLAAAATVAVVGTGVVVALGRPAPDLPPVPPSGSSPVTQPSTSDTSPAPGYGVRVPVYFAGVNDRLFREFQMLTVPTDNLENRIAAATERSVHGQAVDPDYDTRWAPEFGVARVTVDGSVATVELTGPAAPADPLAAQQIVYTATAAAADHGTQLSGVRILVNGVELPGGVLVRAASLLTLAPLWLISPQQGETVGPNVDLHVAGAVFEATARVRVRASDGTVVEDTFMTLDAGAPERGEGHLPLTLAPGRYTIEVFYESPQDSSEQGLDDHDITVA